jgi:hypothetical protein
MVPGAMVRGAPGAATRDVLRTSYVLAIVRRSVAKPRGSECCLGSGKSVRLPYAHLLLLPHTPSTRIAEYEWLS